jgi:error-prone DNA polymerase
VPLYQEQGMRLAMAIGGFSAGEADALRRAMGKYRSPAAMRDLEARFHAGAAERGVGRAAAETVWKQLAAFASYGFPASHACSFALLTYQSAWLRHYYPVEFRAALLNSQPMGFYSPRVIVGDAHRHGIVVLGPAVGVADDEWVVGRQPDGTLALRVGLRACGWGGAPRGAGAARRDGPPRCR